MWDLLRASLFSDSEHVKVMAIVIIALASVLAVIYTAFRLEPKDAGTTILPLATATIGYLVGNKQAK